MSGLLLQAWAPGLVNEQTLYRYTAVALGVAALGFLLWTARLADRHRRYGLLATWIVAVTAASYGAMSVGLLRFESVDGSVVPVSRFVGYFFSIALTIWVTGRVAGLSRRMCAVLLVPFVMINGGTLGGWFLPDPLNSLASLSSLLSLPIVAYLFLGPGQRSAAETTPNRKLLYGKLQNVILLVWIGYLVVGIVSRQNAGLLDAFVGVFLGMYLDVVIVVGFGAILLRHTDALDDMVGAGDGGTFDGETSDASATETDAPTAAD